MYKYDVPVNWESVLNSPFAPRYLKGRDYFNGDEYQNTPFDGGGFLSIPKLEQSFCEKIIKIKKEAEFVDPKKGSIILHGSYADEKVTNFSDIDILFIVNDQCIDNYKDILMIRKIVKNILSIIYKLDPLIHHGLMVLSQSKYSNYDESFLPIDTYRYSKVLTNSFGGVNYKVNSEISINNAKKKLENGIAYFLHRVPKDISLFNIKDVVSNIFLMAVIWLQARKGLFLYKRTSLGIFRAEGPLACQRALTLATEIREIWPKTNMGKFQSKFFDICRFGGVSPHVLNKAHSLSFNRVAKDEVAGPFKELLQEVRSFATGLMCE